ncbi:hypothetical protein FHL15_006459 [Xylaria flabelliformis]|uniref:Uncharacterized protein n=1 Tax=Xylaria flabelliformis TaxID=2512241 RepID=A0A553HX58_9PEZI|nr:hypothetical protein FHL15_006459 [Xylaria flabelliformis]
MNGLYSQTSLTDIPPRGTTFKTAPKLQPRTDNGLIPKEEDEDRIEKTFSEFVRIYMIYLLIPTHNTEDLG